MPEFRVTYDITTPESAEHGDCAESGFLDRNGNRIAALIGKPTPGVGMTLREARKLIGGALEDSGYWLTEADGRPDYQSGAVERRSLHPPERISGASYGRLCRLLGVG